MGAMGYAPVDVVEAHDVVLAEIAANLHLDQFERDLAGICLPASPPLKPSWWTTSLGCDKIRPVTTTLAGLMRGEAASEDDALAKAKYTRRHGEDEQRDLHRTPGAL